MRFLDADVSDFCSYDGYDGLPEGRKSSVTASPRLQKLQDDAKSSDAEAAGGD